MKIFKQFLQYLESHKRKYAFVDMYGDVLFYRYYVGYVEKNSDTSWKARWLPNLYIHHFPGSPHNEGPDGDQPHYHPWSVVSVVLRNGYTAVVNRGPRQTHQAISTYFMSYKQCHNIVQVLPDTWTLFFHGIRRQPWLVDVQQCESVCSTCKQYNNNTCSKTAEIRLIDPDTELVTSSKQARGWRKAKWIVVDKDFAQLINLRKATLDKLSVSSPKTNTAKLLVLKQETIKEKSTSKDEKTNKTTTS